MPTTSELPTPDEFLAAFQPEVQVVAQRLRRLVHATIPQIREAVCPGWRLIGYRLEDGGKGRYFCFIAPKDDHVRLGFEYGTLLNDEHRVLEGAGKQVRYVTIRPAQELQADILEDLVHEAAMIVALHRRSHARLR